LKIIIDINDKTGTIKPINGINNGPVCFGSLIDSTRYYKQAAFPYCRIHDTNYPHPREVDIPVIFKNFSADPDDPANYDFRATDIYLNEILATGAQIIYRLGTSIEHSKLKYYVDPPLDFDKWAKICLNIAKHYNEGWANGFNMNIEYWEVWNEPDQLSENRREDVMWSGTPEQYYDLYVTTGKLFKKEMPYVNIGGYAGCGFLEAKRYDYFINFLEYVKKNESPLDFYSWHIYTSNLEDIKKNADLVRDGLNRFGFKDTKSILDEWNYAIGISDFFGAVFDGEGSQARYEFFSESSSEVGTAFTAAALIEMLDLDIDIANFYCGDPTNMFCTIFDRYGRPSKQFYAFDAFNQVRQSGDRIRIDCGIPEIKAFAAASEGKISIMLVNWDANTTVCKLEYRGLNMHHSWNYKVSFLDKHRNLENVNEGVYKTECLPETVTLQRNTAALINIIG
jgi:hypothetical protein